MYEKDGKERKKSNELKGIEDKSCPRQYTGGGISEPNPYIITFDIMKESLEKTLEGKPTSIKLKYVNEHIGEDWYKPTYYIYFENENKGIKYSYKIQRNEFRNWEKGLTRRTGDSLFKELLEYYKLETDKELSTFEIIETKVHKYYLYAKDEDEAKEYGKMIMDNKEEYQYSGILSRKEYIYREII